MSRTWSLPARLGAHRNSESASLWVREGGRGILRGKRRPQYVLIVAEVALTLILLVGTGLMMRSLHNLWNVSPGFNPQDVVIFHSSLSPRRSSTPEKTREAFHELNDRL